MASQPGPRLNLHVPGRLESRYETALFVTDPSDSPADRRRGLQVRTTPMFVIWVVIFLLAGLVLGILAVVNGPSLFHMIGLAVVALALALLAFAVYRAPQVNAVISRAADKIGAGSARLNQLGEAHADGRLTEDDFIPLHEVLWEASSVPPSSVSDETRQRVEEVAEALLRKSKGEEVVLEGLGVKVADLSDSEGTAEDDAPEPDEETPDEGEDELGEPEDGEEKPWIEGAEEVEIDPAVSVRAEVQSPEDAEEALERALEDVRADQAEQARTKAESPSSKD